jgi:hypothetical protein
VLKWLPEQTDGRSRNRVHERRTTPTPSGERISSTTRETRAALLKNWTNLKLDFLKRFGKSKTRAAQVQGLGQLWQSNSESCNTYLDRVVHRLNKLTAKPMTTCRAGDHKKGFLVSALFLNGLRSDVKMYVEKEESTAEEIYRVFQKF